MTQRHLKPAYAKMDAAHLFDGLFVPTGGKTRGRLYVAPRTFGDSDVSFQGFEQLGADDQSILLALSAQLGIDGLVIEAEPAGPTNKQLRLQLEIKVDDGSDVARTKTSLRSILVDAGYGSPDSGRALSDCRASLNRLANAQIRESRRGGWDRRSNLISVAFNNITGDVHVAANPRLTGAIFNGQHVKVSLFERNALETETSKILHAWLCSNVRLGRPLGRGNGVHLDTLGPHVWGEKAWEEASKQVRSRRRTQMREALDEIREATGRIEQLGEGYGWAIDRTGDLVHITRPAELPAIEWSSAPRDLDQAGMNPRLDRK